MIGIGGIFELIIVEMVLAVCPLAGAAVARDRNRSWVEGFVLGQALGPLGIVIEVLLPRKPSGNNLA